MTQATPDDAPLPLPDGSVQTLILDAYAPTRIGLGMLLHRQRWVSRCLLAADRDEAVALIERHRPDVAVIDVSDVGPFLASYLAPIKTARPAMTLVLSSRCGLTNPAQLLAAGAALLTPDLSVEDLLATIRGALAGGHMPARSGNAILERLSDREREVLGLLCTGATNQEIAAAMHVGTDTVKKHAGSLYRKLGVRNRTEAAQRAAALLTT